MPERLSLAQRMRVEDLRPGSPDVRFGAVAIDPELCHGCGYCVRACPANTIELHEKKARMVPVLPMCMACGDCTATCPEHAITITTFIAFHRCFQYLDRGQPETPRKF